MAQRHLLEAPRIQDVSGASRAALQYGARVEELTSNGVLLAKLVESSSSRLDRQCQDRSHPLVVGLDVVDAPNNISKNTLVASGGGLNLDTRHGRLGQVRGRIPGGVQRQRPTHGVEEHLRASHFAVEAVSGDMRRGDRHFCRPPAVPA
jgi:hypothetical protein